MLAAAAVIPALASRRVSASTIGNLIAPPSGTMRFERTVIRQLSGGANIAVTRAFEIGFTPFADGFLVEGQQVAAQVEAPANLASFARLEQARVETSTFPITLDPFGQILSDVVSIDRASEVDQAFGEALQQIAQQPITSGERGELQQFVSALHLAGTMLTVLMPSDLFAPAENEWSENRALELPTGDIGRVVSRFDAIRDAQTGLMRRATREVLTEIDGDRRQTTEHWQLSQT